MPLALDVFTMMAGAAAVTPLVAAAQVFLWWQTREKALAWWAAGSFSLALGTLVSLGASGPGLLSALAAASLVFGHAFLYRGILVFQGQTGGTAEAVGRLALLVLLAVVAVSLLTNRAFINEGLTSVLIAGIAALCAHALAFRHGGQARASSLFTAGIFAASAVVHVACAWAEAAIPDANVHWSVLRVGDFLLLIGWSFGFLMLIGQRNQERIAELAHYDDLTGVHRRRALLDKGRHAYGLVERSGAPLSVMLLDIDLFKHINDTFGHAAGDEVLKCFAKRVSVCLRDTDVFGRIGGEEFCVILPDTGIEGAVGVAERCRSAVAATPFAWRDGSIEMTVSIGVAQRQAATADIDSLIGNADEALYKAKQSGRNCVCRAEQDDAQSPVVRLVWDSRYRSGNAVIDREHEYLFDRANTLLARLQRELNHPAVVADVEEVFAWLTAHFRNEERILGELGWAGAEEHGARHRALEERGQRLLAEIKAGARNFGELLDFVVLEVIGRHLAQHDSEYFAAMSSAAPLEIGPTS
jgi:diguanylate cyclase (GGDEF)-like protein/hemerythrin-like metal-binding protein